MRYPLAVQFVSLALCGALIVGAAQLIGPINASRADLNVYGAESDIENAPPEYAFAIQAFGAFRSLIVDVAFIRAEKLKEEGRYYDAMQLAEWICKLQPHFPAVWVFHSWNMAWNISVTTFSPQERWHWVYNGAKLIRDEGLRYNPRSVNLYKQLAWIFFNKMGADVDEYHLAYKKQWAWRMHLLLGPPPQPAYGLDAETLLEEVAFNLEDDPFFRAAQKQRELSEAERQAAAEARGMDISERPDLTETTELRLLDTGVNPAALRKAAMQRYLESIAGAAESLEQLFAQHPETRQLVADLRELGVIIPDEPLTEDAYWRQGGLAFRYFTRYRELTDPSLRRQMAREEALITERIAELEQFDEIVGVSREDPAGLALTRYLQRRVLVEVYKNDPEIMLQLVSQFGPMDWRMVDAQSLYWTWRAIRESEGVESDFSNDKTNTYRIMMFSLQNLSRRNKLFFEPTPEAVHLSYLNMMPDPAFIESMHEAYVRYAPAFDARLDPGTGIGRLFRSGHVNFLAEGVRTLFFANRLEAANRYYEFLREHYAKNDKGRINEKYLQPLEDFAINTFLENITLRREADRAIRGMCFQSLDALASNELTMAANYARAAHRVYRRWITQKDVTQTQRFRMPPFEEIYTDVFRNYLLVPSSGLELTLHKSRLWAMSPDSMRLPVYDDVVEQLRLECQKYNFDVAKAFPPPPGLEEYRASRPRRQADGEFRKEGTVETRSLSD